MQLPQQLSTYLHSVSALSSSQLFRNPERDWPLMLIAATVLSLFLVLVSAGLYVGLDNGELFALPPQETGNARILDTKELEERVAEFKAHQSRFETLRRQ